jgi:hypothetical protein
VPTALDQCAPGEDCVAAGDCSVAGAGAAPRAAAGGGSAQLPFTGLNLVLIALFGIAQIALGMAIRGAAHRGERIARERSRSRVSAA